MLYYFGMGLARILSYVNPCSTKHKDTSVHFATLSLSNKICVVALTVLATLATLPLLGLGGLATFRYMTAYFFKTVPPAQEIEDVGVYLETHRPQCLGMQKRKIKLEQADSYNIVRHLSENAMLCKPHQSSNKDIRVIIKGLNHHVSYRKPGVSHAFGETFTLMRDQTKIHSFISPYRYYQLTIDPKEKNGVYLETQCPCSGMVKRKIRLKTAAGYNIIGHLDTNSMQCKTCDKQEIHVIVNGLSHKISYKRNDVPRRVNETAITLAHGQRKSYAFNGPYAYYQLAMG